MASATMALTTIDECIEQAMAAIDDARKGCPVDTDAVDDPLGGQGRRALAALGSTSAVRAILEWARAYREFQLARADLFALAADDALRAGRHQKIYDAGMKWRRKVFDQRRRALLAATRTVRRALVMARD